MEELSIKKRRTISSKNGGSKMPVEMISCYNSERIHFDGIKLSGTEPPMKSFMESDRIFPSILLDNVTLTNDHYFFWEKCGENITELVIRNCFFSSSDLIVILKNLTNLTNLVILKSRTLFNELFIDIEKGNKDLFASASKLSSFIIDKSWSGLGSVVLAKLFLKMPNIIEFEISLVDEDLFIVECLKLWENQLKSLRLKNKICMETRNKIYQLNISLLEVFQIEAFDGDNGNSLVEFISKQENLLELSIGICGVDENLLVRIGHAADKLNVLSIYNTEDLVTVCNKDVLQLFGKLQKLFISVQSYNSLDCFLCIPNENLTHLVYDQAIEMDEDRVSSRYYDIPFYDMKLTNLTYFEVSDDFISNFDIQVILKYLIGLEVLKVKTKHTLSDFAFSGKGERYPKQEKDSSLTSNRKWKGPLYTLGRRLTNLNELDIQSSDNQFSDLALDRISKLKKLKIINLSNYKGITITGIENMIASCLRLEQITITGCSKKIANEISSLFKKRIIKVIYNKKE